MGDFPSQVNEFIEGKLPAIKCARCGKEYTPRSGLLPPTFCEECLGTATRRAGG